MFWSQKCVFFNIQLTLVNLWLVRDRKWKNIKNLSSNWSWTFNLLLMPWNRNYFDSFWWNIFQGSEWWNVNHAKKKHLQCVVESLNNWRWAPFFKFFFTNYLESTICPLWVLKKVKALSVPQWVFFYWLESYWIQQSIFLSVIWFKLLRLHKFPICLFLDVLSLSSAADTRTTFWWWWSRAFLFLNNWNEM